MAAQKGNQFWKLRSKHGRDKIFGDAKILLEEAYTYFEWCDKNPLKSTELVKYQGAYTEANVPVSRPYTVTGLMYFLGVSSTYFYQSKVQINAKRLNSTISQAEEDLLDAIEHIEMAIQTQQFEGATVGLFNGTIITRVLGLVDKKDITSNGESLLKISVRDAATASNLDALTKQLDID